MELGTALIIVMTEPSDPALTTWCLSNSLPSTPATFLVTSAALHVEDVRWIAQEVASILRDIPSYNPLTSTSTSGVATSGKSCSCFVLDTPT